MDPVLQRAGAVGIARAMHCFPLYEHALRAHEGATLAAAQDESGALWAELSSVAAANPYAWSREARDADDVAKVGPGQPDDLVPVSEVAHRQPVREPGRGVARDRRRDRARARASRRTRWVHPLGGAGADEPTDPRARAAYHHVPALDVTVREVQEVTGTTADEYDVVELYSCFPAMPKLTRRALGRDATAPISVTGGLSFFGGPGSNYLTHSLAAMVERLRADGGTGFVHGVGMFNTKHHALVLRDRPRDDGAYPAPRHDVGVPRPPVTEPVPVVEDYAGPATVVTCTVMFDREGAPESGAVICTGAHGERAGSRGARPRHAGAAHGRDRAGRHRGNGDGGRPSRIPGPEGYGSRTRSEEKR